MVTCIADLVSAKMKGLLTTILVTFFLARSLNAAKTFTAVREYFLGFPLNYQRNSGSVPSLLLLTYETTSVTCVINVPNIGRTYNLLIVAGNETFVELPHDEQTFQSSTIDNKGIHVQVDSNRVILIGQNFRPDRGDTSGTFLALPTPDLNMTEYTYFELDMVLGVVRWPSQILVVGTQSNTTMNITVTQPVRTIINGVTKDLAVGTEYSFSINRLQTFYVTHPEDLTGSKIVTDKPISLFSGHACATLPSSRGDCDHMIEQSPPTAMWGRTFYVAPIPKIGDIYYIRVLAANEETQVDIYCNNTKESFTIHEGEFIHKQLPLLDHCAIHSNKPVLVAQYASSAGYPSDPAMALVPATIQYSHRILSSTASYQTDLRYIHSLIVIVLADYFSPNLIYMNSGGTSESLDAHQWVPIQANDVIEAYYTHVTNISTGSFEVSHVNQMALLNTILFGFSRSVHGGYGHAGRLEVRTSMSNDTANVSQPEVPVNASRPDAPMNVRIPEINVTHESFVVQWEAVMDTSSVNYTVRWVGEDGINATATMNRLSYTVTGLTENTSYNVTVFAVNICCGPGPASEAIMVTTGVLPNTLPPVTQTPPNTNDTFSSQLPTTTTTSSIVTSSIANEITSTNINITVATSSITFAVTTTINMSGTYNSQLPTTTTTPSIMTSSIANVNITMATSSTTFAVTTTINMSGGVSNGSNENNDGIIIAAVAGIVAVALMIMTIIMCTVLFYRHNRNKKKSEVTLIPRTVSANEIDTSFNMPDDAINNDPGKSSLKGGESTGGESVNEEPKYSKKDLEEKSKKTNTQNTVVNYRELNQQQKKSFNDVQAMIIVVNQNEFMATMCYLKPPNEHSNILEVHGSNEVGFANKQFIFYIGMFGKCSVAVTRVDQGRGRDAIDHIRCFKNILLIAAVGVAAGFPENKVHYGDVIISKQIKDCSIYRQEDGSRIPRGNTTSGCQYMINRLQNSLHWEFVRSKQGTKSSVICGLFLSKSVLLDSRGGRAEMLRDFGEDAKGFEMEGYGITGFGKECIIIKGVCDYASGKTKEWQPTAALAANDYLYHHLNQLDISSMKATKDEGDTDYSSPLESIPSPGEKGDNSASSSTEIVTLHDQLLKYTHSQLTSEITRLHVIIKDHINFENLIPFLNKNDVFTKDEIKFLMNNHQSGADKVSHLIMWLHAKNEKGIHNFVKALVEAQEHSGHLVILNHLHESLIQCS